LVKFALQFKKLEDAVAAVIDFLGAMQYTLTAHTQSTNTEHIVCLLSVTELSVSTMI
jgi:hypothetical protein